MKLLKWVLILFISLSSITGCAVAPPPIVIQPSPYIFVPVTWEVVGEIVNQNPAARTIEFEDLDYFLSGTINLVTNESERTIHARAGRLVIREQNISAERRLTSSDRGAGRFINHPAGRESFEVFFPDSLHANLRFVFARNMENNSFELASVQDPITGTSYSLQHGGILPQLSIFLDYRKDGVATVLQSAATTTTRNPTAGNPTFGSTASNPTGTVQLQPVRQESRLDISPPRFNREIIGTGVLDRDSITSFILSQGSSMSRRNVEEIVSIYIEEARKEGINHDIAIAQMLNATNFLSQPGILRTHNYGALRRIDHAAVRFPNMRLGIRSHIQQLKVHVSRDDPAEQIVDALRFNTVRTNTDRRFPRTLDELLPIWEKENPSLYRHDISMILAQMYSF